MDNVNRYLSLETLENSTWKAPEFDSNLVKQCHDLRKIPIKDLSIEDLRILIGQEIGLKYLVQLAIEKLSEDILAEGDFYPGDLLTNVLKINKTYWTENKTHWIKINELISQNHDKLENHNIDLNFFNK